MFLENMLDMAQLSGAKEWLDHEFEQSNSTRNKRWEELMARMFPQTANRKNELSGKVVGRKSSTSSDARKRANELQLLKNEYELLQHA